jgi:hypothetical protein
MKKMTKGANMRVSRNILNNMMMDNQRRNPLYQTILTDLAITGNIPREDAEMLLGYEIPAFLKTPDGSTIADNDIEEAPVATKQPVKKETSKNKE